MEAATETRRSGVPAHGPLFAAALLLAACAGTGVDTFGDPKGYVAPTAAAGADWNAAETVTVTITDYAFDPADLHFAVARPYRLRLENAGTVAHYFASETFFKAIAAGELSGRGEPVRRPYLKAIAVAPGESRELTFVAVRVGDYDLVCTAPFHESLGMRGWIAIR